MSGLPRVQAAVRRRLADDRFLIVGLLLLFAASTILWDWRYRHGQPYDIDESGYLSISLADFHSLGAGGLISWIKQVESASPWSPLTTMMSTPFYLVFGPKALAGLLSPLVYMLVAIAATYALARRMLPRPAAWIAVVLVASTPLVINYSRDYIFAAAATGVVAVALLCFERSDQMRSRPWSLLFGVAVGLLPLARTMAVAFLPAFAIVVVLAVALHPKPVRRGLNAGVAVVAAVVTAASWLAVNGNGTLVWRYLTQYGYGAASHEYGVQHSLLSYQAWLTTLRYFVAYLYLPHLTLFTVGAVLTLGLVVKYVARVGGPAVPALLRHPLAPCVVLLAEGFTALSSSGNGGDAFSAPLVVPLSVISGWALWRVLGHRPRLVAALVSIPVLFAVLPSLPVNWLFSGSWQVTLPQLGSTMVASGQGVIQRYEASDVPGTNTDAGQLAIGHAWVAANQLMADRIAAAAAPNAVVGYGFRHLMVNVNSINLVRGFRDQPAFLETMVPREQTGDTVAGYRSWLTQGQGAAVCVLLSATGLEDEMTPTVSGSLMGKAAQQVRVPGDRPVAAARRANRHRVATAAHLPGAVGRPDTARFRFDCHGSPDDVD